MLGGMLRVLVMLLLLLLLQVLQLLLLLHGGHDLWGGLARALILGEVICELLYRR